MDNTTTPTAPTPRNKTSTCLTNALCLSTPNAVIISPSHFILLERFAREQKNHKDGNPGTCIALAMAVQYMSLVKDVAIPEPAKTAFAAACTLLTMIQDTMSNDEDLVDLGVCCANTCIKLERATFGKRKVDVSANTTAAISELHQTIEMVQDEITKATQKTFLVRMFFSKLDKEKISGWKASLNNSLNVFNAEIALSTNVAVGQIDGKVDVIAQGVSVGNEGIQDLQRRFVKIEQVFNTSLAISSSHPSSEPPPPSPGIFFGRADLVEKTVGLVTLRQHVALIGLGGIGKTCISKVVLNEPAVIDHFGNSRHFISCDGFLVSLETFVSRIAQAVGATVNHNGPLSSLSSYLSSLATPILIVIDNAETVLDAGGIDAQFQITQAIEEIASCSCVSVIITTRTAAIPNNVKWHRIIVPALDMDAARDAFSAIYEYDRPSPTVDLLLRELGCHALSINLLAGAGAQNGWTISELHQQWKEERTHVLDLDDSNHNRMQSLSASIQLSLNSPTLQKLGDKALQVLQVIAFLPQGVDQTKLQELFPSVPEIKRVMDTMKRLSLTYLDSTGFITMLAPIRLHIQSIGPSTPGLLADTQSFYFEKLDENHGMKARWIASEDDNVEKLIVHALSIADGLEVAVRACRHFLYTLYWNKPRTMTLTPIVRAVAEVDGTTYWKANSLQTTGLLAQDLGRYTEATELLGLARQVATAHGHTSLAAQCSFSIGDIGYMQKDHCAAESSYRDALKEYQKIEDEDGVSSCNERLGHVEIERGNFTKASRYLSEALKYREKEPDSRGVASVRARLGDLEFKQGNHAEGRRHFEAALAIFTKLDVDADLGWCLWTYARAEQASHVWVTVLDLFERAQQSYSRANDAQGVACCQLRRGQIFFYQRELALAQQCFEQAKGRYEKAGSAFDRAECLRGLGEIKSVRDEDEDAKALFAEARGLYDLAGRAPIREGTELLEDLRWNHWKTA